MLYSNVLQQSEALCVSELQAMPVQRNHAAAFYHLIQEQAAQHASSLGDPAEKESLVQRLYQTATGAQGISAFLVFREGVPLGTVTYKYAHSEKGAAVYLEDIVTTQKARGQGVGRFAMSVLAQIALHQGYDHLFLECLKTNGVAQKFYTGLGAEVCSHRQTWGTRGPAGGEGGNDFAYFTRPLAQADVSSVVAFMGGQPQIEACQSWLRREILHPCDAAVFLVACERGKDQPVGFLHGFRNYSTFGMNNGVHVGGLHILGGHEKAAASLLEALGKTQREKGWGAHTLLSFHVDCPPPLESLMARGYTPLTYGESQMTVRTFSEPQLQRLAATHPVSNLSDFIPSAPRSVRMASLELL